MTLVTLRPNAPGDLTEMFSQFPASGAHWDKVCEVVCDNDVTYVETRPGFNDDLRDLYHLGGLPPYAEKITDVTVTAFFRKLGGVAATCIGNVGIKTGGVIYWGVNNFLIANGYQAFSSSYNTNPGTLAPWTPAEVDALQAGARGRGGGFGSSVRCSQVYVVVTCYIPEFNKAYSASRRSL